MLIPVLVLVPVQVPVLELVLIQVLALVPVPVPVLALVLRSVGGESVHQLGGGAGPGRAGTFRSSQEGGKQVKPKVGPIPRKI